MDRKLVDYVSLDYKALPHKFEAITKSQFYDEFNQSLKLLQNSDVEFEVRTTVHSELFSEFELIAMTKHLVLGYKGKYYLQNFVNDTPIIGNIEKRHRELRAFPFSQNNLDVIIRI